MGSSLGLQASDWVLANPNLRVPWVLFICMFYVIVYLRGNWAAVRARMRNLAPARTHAAGPGYSGGEGGHTCCEPRRGARADFHGSFLRYKTIATSFCKQAREMPIT